MNCPICNVNLNMTDRHGIEVDYCPQCRGVWLDRGELEKIIERSANYETNYKPSNNYDNSPQRNYSDDRNFDNRSSDNYHKEDKSHYHRKKESFLSDLFDF